jgi:hypothetical protein
MDRAASSGEPPAPGGQVFDPLACHRDVAACGQGEFGAVGVGGGVWFGRTERGEPLLRMPAAQFGVGGHGQVALDTGGGFPVRPVGHDAGEDALAVPVGVLHGVRADRQQLVPGGPVEQSRPPA